MTRGIGETEGVLLKPRGPLVGLFVLILPGVVLGAWAAMMALNANNLTLGLVLLAVEVILPALALSYLRNAQLTASKDKVGARDFRGHLRTVPRNDVASIEMRAKPVPHLIFKGREGSEVLRVTPALFGTRQIASLRDYLGLPQPPAAKRAPQAIGITYTPDGIVVQPYGPTGGGAMAFLYVLAFMPIWGSLLFHLPLSSGQIFMTIGGVFALTLANNLFVRNARLFVDKDVVGRRDLFGITRTCPRDQFATIEVGRGRAARLLFMRKDGRTAFSVNYTWWKKEQIGAVAEVLGVANPMSDDYLAAWLSRGMRPPKRD